MKGVSLHRFGIVLKLAVVFLALTAIFYFTTLSIFISIKDMSAIARTIVTTRFEIASAADKLIDDLLTMEENQKKYFVLRKDEYRVFFLDAFENYGRTLSWLKDMSGEPQPNGSGGPGWPGWPGWKDLHDQFMRKKVELLRLESKPGETATEAAPQTVGDFWIEEAALNGWTAAIARMRQENEHAVESGMRELFGKGQAAERLGTLGLAVSACVGVLGTLFIALSIYRPLRELRAGIRRYARDGSLAPVKVTTRDELGELAGAFNDMTARIKTEEDMRSDFISMLSHEIRTPLTSIKESVDLIRQEVLGPVGERQRQFLDIAASELARISNLLRRLMQVSSMSGMAGGTGPAIEMKPFDAAELVENSLDRLLPVARSRNVALKEVNATELPQALGDVEHLRQALLNLIGNAIKFSPPGSTVRVSANPAPPGEVRFCVTDDGPGIPEAEQAFVFHKYFRGDTLKNEVDGVGLGLNITKQIVEAHGGHIWVQSAPGKGASFCFTVKAAS